MSVDSELTTYDLKVPSRRLLLLETVLGRVLLYGGMSIFIGIFACAVFFKNTPEIVDWAFDSIWPMFVFPFLPATVGIGLLSLNVYHKDRFYEKVPQGRIIKKDRVWNDNHGGYYFRITIDGYTLANERREYTIHNVNYDNWLSLEEGQLYVLKH